MNNSGFGIWDLGLKKNLTAILTVLIILGASINIYPIAIEGDAYSSAVKDYNNKDFDQARQEMTEFIKDFPDSKYVPELMIKLGSIAEEKDKSIEYYSRVIEKYQGSEYEAEAEYDLGQLYYATEDFSRAKEYFSTILDKHKDSPWLEPSYYGLMLALYGLKQYQEASSIYNDYKNNKTPGAFKNRMNLAYADVLFNQGNYQDSISGYKEVINSGQNDQNIYIPFVYSKLIAAMKETGDNKSTEGYIKDLVDKYPDSKEAKYYTLNLDTPTPEQATTPEPVETIAVQAGTKSRAFFTVQAGAYTNKKFADLIYNKLLEKKYPVYINKHGRFYAVQVGKFKTQKAAKTYGDDFIKKEKLKAYLIKQETE